MKSLISLRIASALGLLAASLTAAQTVRQTTVKPTPASSGAQMFHEYCAVCHGNTGKGDGPAAPALKKSPANLTDLQARNKGTFPGNHIFSVIKGDPDMPSAHGSKDMPVWGTVFNSLSHGNSSEVQLRITNLVEYVKSMQVKM